VHIADEGQYIQLAVTDNGMGIPAAYVDKVFQKFFRVPSGGRHNIKGYGLGLSYVQHIVHAHGGTIGVTSTEAKGSTFTVKLPKL
jgi:two-component system phosphate regulon sensor histidine kinase PhoR